MVHFIKIIIFNIFLYIVFSDSVIFATCTQTTNCGSDITYPDYAGDGTSTGIYNTASGYHVGGMNITTGLGNTVSGYESGRYITTGDYNVAIGYNAGSYNTTGSDNIFIGTASGSLSTGLSDKLYIDNSTTSTPLIGGDFSSNTLTINGTLTSTGNITGNSALSVSGAISAGSITSSGAVTGTSLSATGASTISISSGSITDTSGTIDFGNENLTTTGNITANEVRANRITDSSGDNYLYKDTVNDIVHLGTNSMLFYDSSTYGKDIMASSSGKIQIGNSPTDTTTIVGDLIVDDPTEAYHASTRRYSDKVSLMAASLDTRLPTKGNSHALTFSSASTNNEFAYGLNFVGIYDGMHLPLDFSLGSAFSGEYNMGKLSLGMSW